MAKEKSIFVPAMSREKAEAEVESWLDYKKVDALQRENQEDAIQAMISYVMSGHLQLNEDMSFTHILKWAIGVDKADQITQLVYKPRLTEREISQKLHGIKSDDGDGRLAAHVAALCSQTVNIAKALDKEDFKIARSVALFFV